VLISSLREKSMQQRVAMTKYLALYLPWLAVPAVAVVYGSAIWQFAAPAVALPFLILIPFCYSKKLRLVETQKRRDGAA
jgi:hypothetical protein